MTAQAPAKRRILLVNGHPDPRPDRLCSALASAYAEGATAAGHIVRRVEVGALDLPSIGSQADFMAEPGPVVAELQQALREADHLVLIYPLWLGAPPAAFKAFLEQVFRYGVALSAPGEAKGVKGLLSGRSARVIVTMGMPAAIFRLVFFAHGLKCVSRGVLWVSGFRPIRETAFGPAEGRDPGRRLQWLARARRLGAAAV
ncbi:NAD(P)H-dependent oxidoreductase [Phenylobacterium sp.]|uniref:NAD(P)H-dependent oxidoreductase n=1 Tax=Phenylobacterium sp. TaxID=1871053 RepID=UPI0027318289|nr:NAD(P)H-dependent oxidoreductase [Phenylobacterium sp.]MDP1618713.1 NAD(P)H-dependent oxidoreductase [Phenylobacterium sp.]MDP1986043.1 NAD(P)H-dependent oxidoreductase [Phenylobacterium sp.]